MSTFTPSPEFDCYYKVCRKGDSEVSKYLHHLPLYQQSGMLLRDTGIKLSRNPLCGWVMRVGELLQPIAGAMAQELLASPYLQADETPVDVQLKDSTGRNQ